MMSGSWRIMERMPLTKSSLADSLIEVWRIIAIGYSTGSSRVMMLTDSVLIWFSTEYSVVVLPKSSLADSLIEVWRIIAIGYSTGSSRVMMLTDSVLIWFSTEYSVVVLP